MYLLRHPGQSNVYNQQKSFNSLTFTLLSVPSGASFQGWKASHAHEDCKIRPTLPSVHPALLIPKNQIQASASLVAPLYSAVHLQSLLQVMNREANTVREVDEIVDTLRMIELGASLLTCTPLAQNTHRFLGPCLKKCTVTLGRACVDAEAYGDGINVLNLPPQTASEWLWSCARWFLNRWKTRRAFHSVRKEVPNVNWLLCYVLASMNTTVVTNLIRQSNARPSDIERFCAYLQSQISSFSRVYFAKINIIEHLGNPIHIPVHFCCSIDDLGAILRAYSKGNPDKSPGSGYIMRGDYQVVHGDKDDLKVINARQFTKLANANAIFHISVILKLMSSPSIQTQKCLQCGYMNDQSARSEWITCGGCMKRFRVQFERRSDQPKQHGPEASAAVTARHAGDDSPLAHPEFTDQRAADLEEEDAPVAETTNVNQSFDEHNAPPQAEEVAPQGDEASTPSSTALEPPLSSIKDAIPDKARAEPRSVVFVKSEVEHTVASLNLDLDTPPTATVTQPFAELDPFGFTTVPSNPARMGASSSKEPRAHPGDIVILLVGMTGTGRSTFLKAAAPIGGQAVTIGHTLQICTKEVMPVEVFDPTISSSRIILVDTPPLNADDGVAMRIVSYMENWMREADLRVAGLLYFLRITNPRMNGDFMMHHHALKKLLHVTTSIDRSWSQRCGTKQFVMTAITNIARESSMKFGRESGHHRAWSDLNSRRILRGRCSAPSSS
ncbi:hypothetical protein HGRIS_011043 [Hohenbuehelia grisea]|uniref:Ubiquitin-like domain-containing protein n=1 Tax=Hohenbuehelia grisea TaxID=104357 RepID=A0ABR3IYX5_9AGAR